MSFKSLKAIAAMRDSALHPRQRLVWVALAMRASRDEGKCWAAAPTLARDTGFNERTIRRTLSELEDLGCLRATPRKGYTTVYVLRPEALPQAPDSQAGPGRSDRGAPGNVSGGTPGAVSGVNGTPGAVSPPPGILSRPRAICPGTPDRMSDDPSKDSSKDSSKHSNARARARERSSSFQEEQEQLPIAEPPQPASLITAAEAMPAEQLVHELLELWNAHRKSGGPGARPGGSIARKLKGWVRRLGPQAVVDGVGMLMVDRACDPQRGGDLSVLRMRDIGGLAARWSRIPPDVQHRWVVSVFTSTRRSP